MKTFKRFLKNSSFLLVLLIMLQSCSIYKQTVETDSGSQVKKIKLYNTWVFKTDKSKVKGILYSADLEGITLTKDTRFKEVDFVTIKVSEITKIKFNRKGQLGRSALIGVLSGAAIGALVGYSQGDDEGKLFGMDKESKAVAYGLGFGILGGGVGLIMGTAKKQININGNQREYDSNLGTIQSYSFLWDTK